MEILTFKFRDNFDPSDEKLTLEEFEERVRRFLPPSDKDISASLIKISFPYIEYESNLSIFTPESKAEEAERLEKERLENLKRDAHIKATQFARYQELKKKFENKQD